MATYQVPPDVSAKEKIVGGLLTASQLITILACISIGVGTTFLMSAFIELTTAIVISAVIFLPLAAILTFVKIKGLPVLKIIRLRKIHRQKNFYLKNHRVEADDFKLDYRSQTAITQAEEEAANSKNKKRRKGRDKQ